MNKETLFISVRKILFYDWDPLLSHLVVNTEDEYDEFIDRVMVLIGKKPTISEIVNLLKKLENEIQVDADQNSRKMAASKLKALSEFED